jgi:predicted dehydrogenase
MSDSVEEDFRWGILGTGGIARAFARDLAFLKGHQVAAVGSRSASKAADFASEFPGSKPFASYEELVAADVDAIYVATPHTFHAENSLLALNAGKPVLCEKPFTINAIEARAVIEKARELDLPLLEAIWTRFLPHIQKMREIIASGALGDIHTVIADHGQYLPEEIAPRLWWPELGGGALLDLGIYPITLAHLVLGTPQSFAASATLTNQGVDSQISMIFDYASGAQAMLNATMLNRTAISGVISGSKARLEMDGFFFAPTTMRLITRDGEVEEFSNTYQGHGLREEAVEFARMVRVNEIESPMAPHSMSLEIMELMDAIRAKIGVVYPSEK